jgi:hypothetical protein
MESPDKYSRSPLLGSPARERSIFAFFKGAFPGRLRCTLLLSILKQRCGSELLVLRYVQGAHSKITLATAVASARSWKI